MQNFRVLGSPTPDPRASGGWRLCLILFGGSLGGGLIALFYLGAYCLIISYFILSSYLYLIITYFILYLSGGLLPYYILFYLIALFYLGLANYIWGLAGGFAFPNFSGWGLRPQTPITAHQCEFLATRLVIKNNIDDQEAWAPLNSIFPTNLNVKPG